jgi:hypothetical protein
MLISRSPRFRCTSAALASPSSRGLGHRPFTAVTGVRIPLGTPHTLDFMVQFWSSPCFPNSRFDGKYSGIFRGDRETAADINALQANYRGIANGNFGTPNRELFPPTQELFASRRELPGIIKSARFRRPSRPRRHPHSRPVAVADLPTIRPPPRSRPLLATLRMLPSYIANWAILRLSCCRKV